MVNAHDEFKSCQDDEQEFDQEMVQLHEKDYPFLAINIIDTYNQGWINWIKACLQLAHSEDTPHTQAAPDELKYTFKILSNIPKSIMEAS